MVNLQKQNRLLLQKQPKAIETDEKKFDASIEKLAKDFNDKNKYDINALLQKAADGVDDDEVAGVLEIELQVILSDGVLSHYEVANYLAIAEAIQVDEADAVKDEEEIEIDME